MKYLKEFIIGSSFPTMVLLYYKVYHNKDKKFNYYDWSMKSPIFFGIFNILSLIIAEKFNLSLEKRLFIISIFTSLLIISTARYINNYNYTEKEWIHYYIRIFILYMITWNIIIYYITKYI